MKLSQRKINRYASRREGGDQNKPWYDQPKTFVDPYQLKPPYDNGVDRMDNKLGYIAENCVSCCECCNKAKGTKTYSELMGWISRLISHRSSP